MIRILSMLLFLFCALLTSSADTALPLKPVEGRGIWVDADSIPTNDAAMASFVDSLAATHLNVLLPETVRRGYTIYPSKLDEQDPRFVGYDPLAALIREAHKHKMEVHPWVWVFRQGYAQHPGPIFTKHPEWMAVNKWGETLSANGGYWICPSIPEARDYLRSVIKEVASNYDIDGIHLDYIRFENQSPAPYCYNASCRDKFKAAYGIDPIDIDPLSKMQATWHLWREDMVSSFVRDASADLRAIKPELKISAAVGSDPDNSRVSLLQNWGNWVDNKWVDFLAPMDYTADSDTFCRMVASQKTAVDERTILMPGLGLHTYKTPAALTGQIDISRRMNTDGVTLFAAVYLKDDARKALGLGPFAHTAEVPFRNPRDRVMTLIECARGVSRINPLMAAAFLNDASRLLGYMAYRAKNVGYVAPSPPPLVIPENPLPIQSVDIPKTATAPMIDGKLDDLAWAHAAHLKIANTSMGLPAPVATDVLLTYDDQSLYIAYICQEQDMSKVKATVTKRDGPAFYDDSVEFFLDPDGKRRDYYQLSANTLGAQFDSKLMNPGVNLDWTFASAKSPNGWTAEIAVPFKSLNTTMPARGTKWSGNFARNRWVTGHGEFLIWSVPYGGFQRPERFGTLVFK